MHGIAKFRPPLILGALLLAVVLQALHFHYYYQQPAGRALTWATVDWSVWFLLIGILHAGFRRWSPPGRWQYACIVLVLAAAGLVQIVLSTGTYLLIYPPTRPFWDDVLHLLDKRWFQALLYAVVLWGMFSLAWPVRAAEPGPRSNGLLRLHDGQAVHWLDPADIVCLQSARNYVFVHLADRQLLARGSLASLAGQLPADRFLRISRSCYVQRDRIARIEPYSRYSRQVVLDNGMTLQIGRTHLADVEGALGLR